MGLTNEQVCNAPVRGGGNCLREPGHRGCHSTVTFFCDGCNKRYRGQPYRYMRDADGDIALQFCFLCIMESERQELKIRNEEGW